MPNPTYQGPERREPDNADFRRAVQARLIAHKRIKEFEAAEEEKRKTQNPPAPKKFDPLA